MLVNGRIWTWNATGTSRAAMLDCGYHFSRWMHVDGGVVRVSRWHAARNIPARELTAVWRQRNLVSRIVPRHEATARRLKWQPAPK